MKTNGLLKWLPLIVVGVASAVAWGANMSTTVDHGKRLTINEKTIKKLSEGRARIDERTRAILRSQNKTEQDIRTILRQLERGRRPVR